MASGSGMLGGPLMYTGDFTKGMMAIPAKNKCPMPVLGGGMGDNKSPALSWNGGPAETKSFALVLYDTGFSMLHWVLWDIPPTVFELPEGLASGYELMNPMGAHQVTGTMGGSAYTHAYYGPCSGGAAASTYEFRLYALNTAKLTLTESSTAVQAQMAVEAAKIDMAVWSGKPM
jgi:Raf kinase inhibitor-like YbhB/YbcL family protein